ncbi:hypothetical protein [Herbaspirillum sp. YR522]|uniref:hypothetical protein n=1 Tax=Herbaspirillum sp. YR522 TaxID=1144342 RepID=UPI00026F6DD1|nr:hypothetical protein [Herbaspirillum sp. YR522]EJN07035.1 hypothetical protein PMI40_02020 [Herbaspirillum sp. YR522]
MSEAQVTANYRFVGAYQEVNTRIAQRQQALTIYVSMVLSLLAALVALKPGTAGAPLPIQWLVLGFPVASTFLALMSYKAEMAITNLRRFLCTLERLGNDNGALPSYNANASWSINANRARQMQDYAAALLAAGGNAVGLLAAVKIYPVQFAESPSACWIAGTVAVVSVGLLLWIPRLSFIPVEDDGSR